MEKVNGFGGFFFRARDPVSLAKWYSDHLGIADVPRDWYPDGGQCAFCVCLQKSRKRAVEASVICQSVPSRGTLNLKRRHRVSARTTVSGG